MRSNIKKGLAIILSIVTMAGLLSGCQGSFTFHTGNILKKEDAKEFNLKKTAVDSITQIDIHTRIADVKLIPSDSFYIQIDYLYWEEKPEYSLKGGKLFFDDTDAIPNSYSINFDLNNIVKIYLPENAALTTLKVNSSSGNADLSGFVAEDMKLNISYGDLTIEAAAAAKAKVTLSSGDSKITDFQTGAFDYTNSYGDSDFIGINTDTSILPSGVTFDTFDINASSGDITIDGLNANAISLNDSYGGITCKNINADRLESELSSGDFHLSKSDIKDIDVNSSYGDADISIPGAEEDYNLDLNTSYGSINVGNESYEDEFSRDNETEKNLSATLSSGDVTVDFIK